MHSRRDVLALSGASVALASFPGCSMTTMDAYEASVARIRETLADDPDLRGFVRYATLAPSGHNVQPWRFAVRENGVSILPDLSRRTPVVDPDDHHLFVSLGCAAETFLIAAGAQGRPGTMVTETRDKARIDIELAQGPTSGRHLCEAISKRQSTRSDFDGRAVSTGDLHRLEATAAIDGVSLLLIADEDRRRNVLDLVIQGNSDQMDDPAFVRELKQWIRFNPSEAIETGDGLFSACSGNPTLPTWLGGPLFDWFFEKETENAKYAEQLRSSAGVAVFIADRDDVEGWINVGRSFQRFALEATALGIRHAHVNQPIEVPSVRADFANWLGIGTARPDLVVRFGYAPPMPMSMRRPTEDVIVA